MPTVVPREGHVHVTAAAAIVLTPADAILLAQALVEAAARAEGDRLIDAHRSAREA